MRNLKRALSLALASVMLLGMMVLGTSAASFPDVSAEDNTEAIEVLQALKILNGYEDGSFRPDQTVTRNEMAIIMANLLGVDLNSSVAANPFNDVPDWAAKAVGACVSAGVINGKGPGIYDGGSTVTAIESAAMMLRALGYTKVEADDDWTRPWARLANKIELMDGITVSNNTPMTRNNVAQLVLNGLESTMVDVTSGTNVVGDNFSITTDLRYEDLKSTVYKYDNKNDGVLQLCEKLYRNDLKKSGDSDAFGRSATKWVYKTAVVGTYTDSAVATWTAKVPQKELYNAAGSATFTDDYTWTVITDGVAATSVKGNALTGGLVVGKSSSDAWNSTGKGMRTELYVNSNSDAKTVTVTVINTFVAQVTSVKKDGDEYTLSLSYKGGASVGQGSYKTKDSGFAKDDIVLITANKNGASDEMIQSLVKAASLTGNIGTVKGTDYIRLNGTTYDLSKQFYIDLDNAPDKAQTQPSVGNDAVIYLDAYGYVVAYKGVESTANYLYVKGAESSFGNVEVAAVFADGTEKRITIDEVDGKAAKKVDAKTERVDNTVMREIVYKYTEDGSKYDLTTVGTGAGKGERAALNNATIKKGTAEIAKDVYAGSNTIFVNVDDGNKVYTGYANVASMDAVYGIAVYAEGKIADIIFITDAETGSDDGEGYFFVKSASDYSVSKVGTTKTWTWEVYVDGVKTEVVASKDLNIKAPGLYKIKGVDGDNVTKVEKVDAVDLSKYGKSAVNYATTAKDGLLVTKSDGAYTYDNDTVFVVVTMKDADKVDSVTLGSASDIKTASSVDADTTSVYVVSVKDKDKATPLAKLVVVVAPK